jgi:hypothetical protein
MTASTVTQVPAATGGLPGWGRFAAAATVIVVAGCACISVAAHASPPPLAHQLALFAHFAALILGLGAVMAVDWVALLWVSGRRELDQLLAMAANVAIPIWVGYAGLVFSGLLLEPDLSTPWTRIKLALVLVIGINGVFAAWQHAALQRTGSPRLLVIGAMSAMASQGCWWGATVVGFLSAH